MNGIWIDGVNILISDDDKQKRIKQIKREQNKRYRESHPDVIKANQERWRKRNKDKLNEYHRKYYAEHKESIRANQERWYKRKAEQSIIDDITAEHDNT